MVGESGESSSSSGNPSSSNATSSSDKSTNPFTTESEDSEGAATQKVDLDESENKEEEEESSVWGVLQPIIPPDRKNNQRYGALELQSENTKITFGRDTSCTYIFDYYNETRKYGFDRKTEDVVYKKISKKHFAIIKRPDEKSAIGYTVYIEDFSANGTYVNGEKIIPDKEIPLVNYAEIAIGTKENKAFLYVNKKISMKEEASLPYSFREKYKLENLKLGSGAAGIVMRGYCKKSGNKVAVKIVNKNKTLQIVSQVNYEAVLMREVTHDNIVKILDVFENEKALYIVLEYIEGGELFDLIKENGGIGEKSCKRIFTELLSAIDYLHSKKIIHRDLKPENILLTSRDIETCSIKVTDFGLSRFASEQSLMTTLIGTPLYCAPEVLDPFSEGYTKKVDMWSLGCILYVMLSGYPPFDQSATSRIIEKSIRKGEYVFHPEKWSDVSNEAKHLVTSLLQVDPNKRISIEEAQNHPWIIASVAKRRKVESDSKE